MSTTQALPYHLPIQLKEQHRYLAKILSLPYTKLGHDIDAEIEAMSGTIMYRHLDRLQKQQALASIRNLKNKWLASKLYGEATLITVNPQWGIWSLSNEELLADQEFHSELNQIANFIGLGASVASGKDFIQNLWTQRKIGRGGWTILVIWGAVFFNNKELQKVDTELSNRSSLKSSNLY